MSKIAESALLVVSAGISIASLVYLSRASTSLANIKNYSKDKDLESAHKYLVWCAVLGWIAVVSIVGSLIASFFFAPELDLLLGGWLIIGLLLFSIGFTTAIGIVSSIAAYKIRNSKTGAYKIGDGKKAYEYAIIAASLSLGSTGLLGIGVIIYYIYKHKKEIKDERMREDSETAAPDASAASAAPAAKDDKVKN